ncbi:MAG TPA: SRPBCC family protein, partial [Urbifossiella sp.]|nr:SRPBCC family protein [Urbifossiella sp.]
MFVHRHHLRNLLRPEHYSSAAHQRREIERLFMPTWHPVGVRNQLTRSGDRLPVELLGKRVTVWNEGGDLRASRLDQDPRVCNSFPVRVGTWGEVVFVRLTDRGPTLEEFLSPARTDWADGFGPPFRYAGAWHVDFPCDWKVVLENALETYHVPELHAKTFGDMLPEEDCEHDLRPHYTFFVGNVKQDWVTRRLNGLVRRLG